MRRDTLAVLVLGLLSWLVVAHAAQAQRNLETVLLPGPVSQAHADIETQCGECHVRFSDATQSALCSDCHDEVAGDIAARSGFHGRVRGIDTIECSTCHNEHVGRDAEIAPLDREVFDHDATDHPLRGGHIGVACEECHDASSAFRSAPSACNACHGADDIHQGRAGENCAGCHSEARWQDIRFDHDSTDFPLTGAHAPVTCNGCHVNQRFDGLQTDCYACHRVDDAHRGARGTACDLCHTEQTWTEPTFDHSRDTSFPLLGSHSNVLCESCHAGDPYRTEVATSCIGCHRDDDDHLGRNGTLCDDCHSPAAWREVMFDHTEASGFTLRFAHAEISCAACHRGPIFEVALDAGCHSCHAADDAHAGQQGEDCGQCHNEEGWARGVPFDHGITSFPLLGLHVAVPCEECHLTAEFRNASSTCVGCHERDDVHRDSLGERCEQCHTPAGWPLWRFDHDTQTDFMLLGAHERLACDACHTEPAGAAIELSTLCGDCHQRDDAHRGRFGPSCGSCHTSVSFAERPQ